MKIAIIGAGIAGASCAYFLARAGVSSDVYDRAPKAGSAASGNAVGLFNPRISAFLSPEGLFYKAAFDLAQDVFPHFGDDVNLNRCGALHLMTDEKKQKRFAKMVDHWGWGSDRLQLLSATEASDVAGVELAHPALLIADCGTVCPPKLCAALLGVAGVKTCFAEAVDIDDLRAGGDYDAVIYAGGASAAQDKVLAHMPLRPVRGQVVQIKSAQPLSSLKTTIGYGGYIAPAQDGVHMVGSTFERGVDHSEIRDEDNHYILGKLRENIPVLSDQIFSITTQRASVRLTTRDNFPVIGRFLDDGDADKTPLYLSIAHGSHGLLSGLMGGKILAAQLTKEDNPVGDEVLARLSPARYN